MWCKRALDVIGSPFIAIITASSANVPVVVPAVVERSNVHIKFKVGPRALPCGTPALIW